MTVHICELCGYEYDPRMGDIEQGIAENTDFEELPDGWVCPLCGAGKDDFTEEAREDTEEDF